MTGEPTSSGALGALIWKFGALKVLGFGSALIGAGIMAIFRPPKTRKELFLQGAVALGCSLLFGGFAVSFLDAQLDWVNLATATLEEAINFVVAVHGIIGALAWGGFAGLAVLRDRFAKEPVETVKDVKSI